jgi:hypothetical protein
LSLTCNLQVLWIGRCKTMSVGVGFLPFLFSSREYVPPFLSRFDASLHQLVHFYVCVYQYLLPTLRQSSVPRASCVLCQLHSCCVLCQLHSYCVLYQLHSYCVLHQLHSYCVLCQLQSYAISWSHVLSRQENLTSVQVPCSGTMSQDSHAAHGTDSSARKVLLNIQSTYEKLNSLETSHQWLTTLHGQAFKGGKGQTPQKTGFAIPDIVGTLIPPTPRRLSDFIHSMPFLFPIWLPKICTKHPFTANGARLTGF